MHACMCVHVYMCVIGKEGHRVLAAFLPVMTVRIPHSGPQSGTRKSREGLILLQQLTKS